MNFFLISFLIISIGGLATVVESKNFGWAKAAATNMIYPAYTMSITFCWTKIGDYYEDSVNELIYPEEGLWWIANLQINFFYFRLKVWTRLFTISIGSMHPWK